MNDFIRMAAKNVLRNTRRSLLTTLVIVIGLTFVFIARGFLNGLQHEMRAGMTESDLGHLQITRNGYHDALPAKSMDYLLDVTPELKDLLQKEPGVEAFTERITFGGLINHQASQTTTPFLAIGIDPATEPKVCPRMAANVRTNMGRFILPGLDRKGVIDTSVVEDIPDAEVGTPVPAGKPMAAPKNLPTLNDEYFQVVVGTSMMEGLTRKIGSNQVKAKLNDDMVVLGMDVNGQQHSLNAKLVGILEVANPMASKTLAMMSLTGARTLLGAEGKATQIVVRLTPKSDLKRVKESLAKKLVPMGLNVKTWEELGPFATLINLQDAIFGIVMVVIVIIAIFSIMVTSLMTVMERTREIGALMAMGYNRRHILGLFLAESAVIGLAGGLGGLLVGATVVTILGAVGIPFNLPLNNYPFLIKPTFTVPFAAVVVLTGIVAAILASLSPAWQASRLKPLEALSKT